VLARTSKRNTKNNVEHVIKFCKEGGCGKEYLGHRISKYCEEHRNPKNRVKKKVKNKDITEDNRIFKHKFTRTVDVEFYCDICNEPFKLKIYSKIYIYPKYCPFHRIEHNRKKEDLS